MNYPRTKQAPKPFIYQSGVHRAHRQAALYVERECRGLGLTGPEAHLLGYVQAHEPCPLSELVRVFGHKRSTLTGILDRFEHRGLLVRKLSADDRRSFRVSLTAKGRRTAAVAREVAVSLERSIAAHVSPEDRAAFERVLVAFSLASGVGVRPSGSTAVPKGGRRAGRLSPGTTRPDKRNPK